MPIDYFKTVAEHGYEAIQCLGIGYLGSVYLVQKEGGRYAMKIIAVETMHGKRALKTIEAEMGIKHENIVRFIDKFETKSEIIIIMEHCVNGNLCRQIWMGKKDGVHFSGRMLFNWTKQLTDRLAYLHDSSNKPGLGVVLHGDIKPANILLDENGNLKYCDVAFRKLIEMQSEDESTFTDARYYTAPEVLSGKYYTTKADVFSLGCCLYELMMFESPMRHHNLENYSSESGDSSDNGSSAHSNSKPEQLPFEAAHSPSWLTEMVERMLEKEASNRPSASDLVSEVGGIANSADITKHHENFRDEPH